MPAYMRPDTIHAIYSRVAAWLFTVHMCRDTSAVPSAPHMPYAYAIAAPARCRRFEDAMPPRRGHADARLRLMLQPPPVFEVAAVRRFYAVISTFRRRPFHGSCHFEHACRLIFITRMRR